MSKKLIAVASAAALALSALVAAPATATAQSFAMTNAIGGTTSGLVAATPATITVPAANVITTGASSQTAVTITPTGAEGDVFTATATGAIKLVSAGITGSKDLNVTTLGTQSFRAVLTAGSLPVVHAYTTSTTAGTIVATLTRANGATATTTFHLKGIAGPAYNITPVSGVPSTLAKAATSVVSFKLTDVFGNEVENSSTTATLLSRSTATASTAAMGDVTWDATAKVHKSTMTSGTNDPFIASITLADSDGELTTAQGGDVAGFPDGKKSLLAVVNFAGAGDQVAALTAQLAASRPKA